MDLNYFEARFCFIDFETTGLYPKTDAIIEAGAVVVCGGKELKQYESFVNPGRPIPQSSIAIHGISDDMVQDAPGVEEILPDFLKILEGAVVVAHNVNFDLSFLKAACDANGFAMPSFRAIDTCSFARAVMKGEKSYSLQNLTAEYNLKGGRHHRALDDARICCELLNLIISKIPDGKTMAVRKLIRLSRTRQFKV